MGSVIVRVLVLALTIGILINIIVIVGVVVMAIVGTICSFSEMARVSVLIQCVRLQENRREQT